MANGARIYKIGPAFRDAGLDDEKRAKVYRHGKEIGELFNCGGGWEATAAIEERFPHLYGMNGSLADWRRAMKSAV